MTKLNLIRGVPLVLAIIIAALGVAYGSRDSKSSSASSNMTRACYPKIGGSAITMACTTGADADSGALNSDTTYMMRCDTAAWVRFGAAAVNAAADDWLMGAGEVYFIPTGGVESVAHISCLSQTSDGDCRLLECR